MRLRAARVLIVGAGGLGAPAALYLAAAGVGRIGILDYDEVEASNLQRQVIYTEADIGRSKAHSAREAIARATSFVDCVAHDVVLDSTNAMDIVAQYDVILDASDNVATRYLLNDACVLLKKVLVSGSALRMDGQLTVYNYKNGPCYRCIFPNPPPPETVTNCNDGGVLGVVTGIIGSLQALEVIKIIVGMERSMRVVKLRNKSKGCAVCGDEPTVTQLIDYVQFCGANATDKGVTRHLLTASERVTCEDYKTVRDANVPHILLDVREKVKYDIAHLPGSVNVPWAVLPRRLGEVLDMIGAAGADPLPVYVVCRKGNDSQLAVRLLQASGVDAVKDVVGGLNTWADAIDGSFPKF
ncbi:hypothetical protein HDU83_005585 [Entophlyctis luteolus]|nr:hypothetical protein HDU83_005585 [Entophlyctis luteolus]